MVRDEQPKPIESSGVTHGALIDDHGALVSADRTRGAGDQEWMERNIDKCGQFGLVQGSFELVECRLGGCRDFCAARKVVFTSSAQARNALSASTRARR